MATWNESPWKGASARGVGEVPIQGAATMGAWAAAGAAGATIGAGLEGAGTQGGTDAATVGRADGAE